MKVLNFGSLNIDYTYKVDEFAKPGETISSNDFYRNFGGKGNNQSVALSKAGLEVYHAGSIGKDGLDFIDMLKQNNIHTDYINISELPTGNAFIEVNNKGENRIVLYPGANYDISNDFVDRVLSNFNSGDYLFLQNEISNISYIIDKAYEKNINIIFNPSPIKDNLKDINLNKINYFVINELEGQTLSNKNTPREILDTLISMYPNSRVLLTLGVNGSVYKDSNNEIAMGIYESNVVDTTCAGDTFTGYFFANLLLGKTIEESLKYASKASSIKISREGASNAIPRKEEVII